MKFYIHRTIKANGCYQSYNWKAMLNLFLNVHTTQIAFKKLYFKATCKAHAYIYIRIDTEKLSSRWLNTYCGGTSVFYLLQAKTSTSCVTMWPVLFMLPICTNCILKFHIQWKLHLQVFKISSGWLMVISWRLYVNCVICDVWIKMHNKSEYFK